MDAIAYARFQRYGVRKVAQVLNEIRGQSVERAQQQLPLIPRRCTEMIHKTLLSAAANLQNRLGKKVEPGHMYVKATWVGQGPMGQMKRVLPAPMGRAMTFKRKVCHLTMIVSDERK